MSHLHPHTYTSAGVLFTDPAGRPMLVKPIYKDGWEVPGGFVEPGESPADGAVREIEEELALRITLGRMLVVDYAPNPRLGEMLLFIFDGGTLPQSTLDAIRLQESELSDWRFVAHTALDEHLSGRLARRMRLALEAHAAGTTIYAEHGAHRIA